MGPWLKIFQKSQMPGCLLRGGGGRGWAFLELTDTSVIKPANRLSTLRHPILKYLVRHFLEQNSEREKSETAN